MMGHTHFTFGALFAATCTHLGYAEPTVAFFLGAQIGSLAPDIDHPKALLSKKVPLGGAVAGMLGIRHRTLTHSLFGMALAYAIGAYVIPFLWSMVYPHLSDLVSGSGFGYVPGDAGTRFADILGDGFMRGFMVGYASHILIDLLNPMGVQLFYPFDFLPKKGWVSLPFGWGIKTGSIWELLLTVLCVAAAILIEPEVGLLATVVALAFWYLIGKPGLPRYRL